MNRVTLVKNFKAKLKEALSKNYFTIHIANDFDVSKVLANFQKNPISCFVDDKLLHSVLVKF